MRIAYMSHLSVDNMQFLDLWNGLSMYTISMGGAGSSGKATAELWQQLGQCHAESDDDVAAIKCLQRAVEADSAGALGARVALAVSCVTPPPPPSLPVSPYPQRPINANAPTARAPVPVRVPVPMCVRKYVSSIRILRTCGSVRNCVCNCASVQVHKCASASQRTHVCRCFGP